MQTIPLTRESEVVGRLIVWPRTRKEQLGASDLGLLEELTAQASLSADRARLAIDLVHSRELLAAAREEERRRLRRDLHDGLGSRLAGVVLGLQASRNMARGKSAEVEELSESLVSDVQDCIDDVRRLVYELRPPALDELGLGPAIREHARSLQHASRAAGQELSIEADLEVGPNQLSAAAEVALYRVAIEALTNVVRHSGARHCAIRLTIQDEAALEVTDDGRGMPADWSAGVGVASMRERVAELGGSIEMSPNGRLGTRVLVKLPARRARG